MGRSDGGTGRVFTTEARRSRRIWGVGGNGEDEAALEAADVNRRAVQSVAEGGGCAVGMVLWQFKLSI